MRGERRGLLVVNDWLRRRFARKPGQKVLQTWHGTPLKRLALHRPGFDPRRMAAVVKESRRWDVLLAQNTYSERILRKAYAFFGRPIWVDGYPRNDTLISEDPAAIRRSLGIGGRREGAPLRPDLARRPHRDGRLHRPRTPGTSGQRGGARARPFPDARTGPRPRRRARHRRDGISETARLLLAADALITDYSSVMFDSASQASRCTSWCPTSITTVDSCAASTSTSPNARRDPWCARSKSSPPPSRTRVTNRIRRAVRGVASTVQRPGRRPRRAARRRPHPRSRFRHALTASPPERFTAAECCECRGETRRRCRGLRGARREEADSPGQMHGRQHEHGPQPLAHTAATRRQSDAQHEEQIQREGCVHDEGDDQRDRAAEHSGELEDPRHEGEQDQEHERRRREVADAVAATEPTHELAAPGAGRAELARQTDPALAGPVGDGQLGVEQTRCPA